MRDNAIVVGELRLIPFRELLARGEPIKVGGKALELMSVLAKAGGALVTKDELMQAVWPGMIVEENGLHVHIAALRKAMGTEAGRLKAVRGLGYRLTVDPAVADTPSHQAGEANAPPIVAVLPFEAMSADPDARYVSDGVAEDILLAVSRITGIRTIARASSFQFRGPDKAIGRVAQDLRATHVLDGTVRRHGDLVSVTAELIDSASATVLWADRRDAEASDISPLHDHIAGAVATALGGRYVANDRRTAVMPAAYELYAKARDPVGTRKATRESISLLERSVAVDPRFAAGWSALAYARGMATRWHDRERPFAAMADEVREAAGRALQLDASSGSAHLALGFLEAPCRYRSVEIHLERAEAVTSDDSMVLLQRALFEYTVGRLRTAFRFVARAQQVDPLNALVAQHYANLLAEVGFDEESVDAFALAHKRWPGNWWLLGVPWARAALRGDWAIVDRIAPMAAATNLRGYALPALMEAMLRRPDAAGRAAITAQCEQQLTDRGLVATAMLMFAYGMGLHDEVFDWVDRSDFSPLFRPDGHAPDAHGLLMGTMFSTANARMQKDPRFVRLCSRLGLCGYWFETDKWPDCADDPTLGYDLRAEAAAAIRPSEPKEVHA